MVTSIKSYSRMERYSEIKKLVRWGELFLGDKLDGNRLILSVEDKPNKKFPAYHNLKVVVYNVKSRSEKTCMCGYEGTYRTVGEVDSMLDRLAVDFISKLSSYGV